VKRREFIAVLSGAAAWPLAVRAQQPAMRVIGWLSGTSPAEHLLVSFRAGLSERGYIETKNVSIEYRLAQGHYDRLPALASELAARRVDVIVASNPPAALAAKAATTTIPIVFLVGVDPVTMGLVTSFNRPGGNLTGYTVITLDLARKRIELLREAVPNTAVVGLLVNLSNSFTQSEMKEVKNAADSLGVRLYIVTASSERDFAAAFDTLVQQGVGALVLSPEPFLLSRVEQLVHAGNRGTPDTRSPRLGRRVARRARFGAGGFSPTVSGSSARRRSARHMSND